MELLSDKTTEGSEALVNQIQNIATNSSYTLSNYISDNE